MGTRIQIELRSLLGNPNVRVLLEAQVLHDPQPADDSVADPVYYESYAEVSVVTDSNTGRSITRTFDYYVDKASGQIMLEGDFNYTRDTLLHGQTIAMLINAGAVFTVLP